MQFLPCRRAAGREKRERRERRLRRRVFDHVDRLLPAQSPHRARSPGPRAAVLRALTAVPTPILALTPVGARQCRTENVYTKRTQQGICALEIQGDREEIDNRP